MKKKIAILGCENSHANNFLEYIASVPEYSESIEIVGVYSNEPETSAALSEKYGVKVLADYKDAVGLIDGLIITARHGGLHYEYAKPYIKSGVPMFIDKPITVHEDEAIEFMRALKTGTGAMIQNDGTRTNEQAFWQTFDRFYENGTRPPIALFDRFYETEFIGTREVCGFDERPRKIIDLVKEKGIVCALATAPAFPAIATEIRMGYVNLTPADFSLVTSYENSATCKPNPAYYLEVAAKLGVSPEECLMIGNDVTDDILPASKVGMEVFLLTECLINRIDADVTAWRHGGYDELLAFLAAL